MRENLTPSVVAALGFGMLFAVADWIAVWRRNKSLEYEAKPAALLAFIVAGVLLGQQFGWSGVARWFVPALALSLLGDVLLMLPGKRWFLPGLLAFLLAQGAYIVGFNLTLPPSRSLVMILAIALLDWVMLRPLVAGVGDSETPEMRLPVMAYAVVLSLTLFSGWATWFRGDWGWQARAAAASGVTCFFASDLMLAWDRFVHPSRRLHVAVIVTYHVAQLFLTLVIGLAPV